MDDLKKSPGDYRQKDLFDARAFNATRLEVVHAGVTTTFEKVKSKNKDGQEQDIWKQVAPTAKDVDQAKVDDSDLGRDAGARRLVRRRGSRRAPSTSRSSRSRSRRTTASARRRSPSARAGGDVFAVARRASRARQSSTRRRSTAMVKALGEIK